MPTSTLSSSATPASRRKPLPAWLHRALREPLLHFVVLGGLLFGVDHVLIGRADDPRRIVPNTAELDALRRVWLDNEVLYREGLALQVDRGDTAIRERVIFKSLSVIDAGVQLPPFDDALLRRWFEQHRTRYDEPARYDFQEAVLAGDSSEAAMRAFVDALNAGAPGDAQAGLRVFKGRPHANLEQSYGADFAKALEAATPGDWRAIQSKDGLRVMRLDAAVQPRPAVFEALRGVVLQDWTDATLSEQRSAAVRALTQKYTVVFEGQGGKP